MRRFFLLFMAAVPLLVSAQTFTISDIRVEGLQRIAPASVFSLLNVNVGDSVDDQVVGAIIRDVFASEYFEDVEVLREDNVLIIRVQERPSISEIEVEGNKLIKTEQLMENMEGAGLAVGQIFQRAILEGMQQALQEQYTAQGLYGATVDVEVVEEERNRVSLKINIDEGKAASIVHLNIVGNTLFDDEALLELFELKTHNWLSFFRKDDRYSREKINGDIERLTSFYMDQGYINFTVNSTQVSVTPDKSEVYVTINISEGEKYTVDEVELAGNLVDMEDILRLVIQVRPGQVFSQQLVTTSSDFMVQLLGNRGYFFAEVEGVPTVDEDDKTVDVTFFVEPGARTYINRISFRGNTNTVDEVLRREMRQMEGAPASKRALETSQVRLERLGYFGEVSYETTEVPGTADQIDVEYSVEEQQSGSITGSIGYAQSQGFILQASLQQNNFLGTGTQVGISANTSNWSTSYNFNYFDPYYTIDGVSRGFSLNYVETDYAELGLTPYGTDQFGGSITYGYLISETERLSFNFAYLHTDIFATDRGTVKEIKGSPNLFPGVDNYISRAPLNASSYDPVTGIITPISDALLKPISELPLTAFTETKGFLDREGTKFSNFMLTTSWSQSTLNSGLFPTAGASQSVSFEFSVPGSDLQYYRLRYRGDYYRPLFGEWGLHLRGELGYGDGYGSTEQLPFFQNFYAGGLGTVRGFERNTLGPRSTPYEEYLTQNTAFVKDADGNIILDGQGNPVLDEFSPPAYLLEAELDENGDPLFDANGSPIYRPKLATQSFFTGNPAPFGGNILTVGTAELLFPMPFIKDRSSVRSSVFVDVGNVFSSYCTEVQEAANNCFGFDIGEFRYSAGVSVTWLSGFGPMTFSLAKPFNASNIDEQEAFQFTIGQTF